MGYKYYEKKSKLTLCWDCKNATGGCTWSRLGIPVMGWSAKPTTYTDATDVVHSFRVDECPEYKADARTCLVSDIAELIHVSPSTIMRWDVDTIVNHCMKNGHLVKCIDDYSKHLDASRKTWVYISHIDDVDTVWDVQLHSLGNSTPTIVTDKHGKYTCQGIDLESMVRQWRKDMHLSPTQIIKLHMNQLYWDLINTRVDDAPTIRERFYKYRVSCQLG